MKEIKIGRVMIFVGIYTFCKDTNTDYKDCIVDSLWICNKFWYS